MRRFVQSLALILLLVIMIGMATLAVWQPTQGPQQDQRGASGQQEQHTQEGKESLWRPSTYEPITVLTVALVVFTAVLAVVAVIQIGFLTSADRTAKTAADASSKQAFIAERTLIATHRPHLIVKPNFEEIGGYNTAEFKNVAPIFICSFMNYGNAPAIIKMMATITTKSSIAPAINDLNGATRHTHYEVVAPGHDTPIGNLVYDDEFTYNDWVMVNNGRLFMWVCTMIQYEGLSGIPHETRLCWRYHADTNHFQEYGGEPYNRRT